MYVLIRLLKLLLLVGLGYILYKVLWKGEKLFKTRDRRSYQPPKAIEEMKKDPICGTYIPEKQAILYRTGKETHYFCSEECKQKYKEQSVD
jgi:YHS domain-containing protein